MADSELKGDYNVALTHVLNLYKPQAQANSHALGVYLKESSEQSVNFWTITAEQSHKILIRLQSNVSAQVMKKINSMLAMMPHIKINSFARTLLQRSIKTANRQGGAIDKFWDPIQALTDLAPYSKTTRREFTVNVLPKLDNGQLSTTQIKNAATTSRNLAVFLTRMAILGRTCDIASTIHWRMDGETLWLLIKRKNSTRYHWEAVLPNTVEEANCPVFWWRTHFTTIRHIPGYEQTLSKESEGPRKVLRSTREPFGPLSDDTISNAAQNIMEKCNLNDDWNTYTSRTIRGATGTALSELGIPQDTVMRLGNWNRAATFQIHYNRGHQRVKWMDILQQGEKMNLPNKLQGLETGSKEILQEIKEARKVMKQYVEDMEKLRQQSENRSKGSGCCSITTGLSHTSRPVEEVSERPEKSSSQSRPAHLPTTTRSTTQLQPPSTSTVRAKPVDTNKRKEREEEKQKELLRKRKRFNITVTTPVQPMNKATKANTPTTTKTSKPKTSTAVQPTTTATTSNSKSSTSPARQGRSNSASTATTAVGSHAARQSTSGVVTPRH